MVAWLAAITLGVIAQIIFIAVVLIEYDISSAFDDLTRIDDLHSLFESATPTKTADDLCVECKRLSQVNFSISEIENKSIVHNDYFSFGRQYLLQCSAPKNTIHFKTVHILDEDTVSYEETDNSEQLSYYNHLQQS